LFASVFAEVAFRALAKIGATERGGGKFLGYILLAHLFEPRRHRTAQRVADHQ
jgi:hypothetical protein